MLPSDDTNNIFTRLSSPLSPNEGLLFALAVGCLGRYCQGAYVCACVCFPSRCSVAVYFNGTNIYCRSLLWNPKMGRAARVRPAGFGLLRRRTSYPQRLESALPQLKLAPTTVRCRRCGLLTMTLKGTELLQTHLFILRCFFFFSFLKNLLEYTAFQSLLDRE